MDDFLLTESPEPHFSSGDGAAHLREPLELTIIQEEFRAGRHPRPAKHYRVLVDETVIDFTHDDVRAADILERVGKSVAQGWRLFEVVNGAQVELGLNSVVHLLRHGLERFVTSIPLIIIQVNNQPYLVRGDDWLVADLKVAVGVPVEKVLARIVRNEPFKNLADDAIIFVHAGEEFLSHARRGGSS